MNRGAIVNALFSAIHIDCTDLVNCASNDEARFVTNIGGMKEIKQILIRQHFEVDRLESCIRLDLKSNLK